MQARLAEKLVAVLRPEALGRLARRRQRQERCELRFAFDTPALDLDFGFATGSKSGVTIRKAPSQRVSKPPVFLPARELLTIYPGFVPIYESHYLDFEEDWRDTCLLLGAPALRGPREKQVRELLARWKKSWAARSNWTRTAASTSMSRVWVAWRCRWSLRESASSP
jgi:hypothetical protein